MRLDIHAPTYCHAHFDADARVWRLAYGSTTLATISIDEIRTALRAGRPLQIEPRAWAPFSLALGGLRLLLSAAEVETSAGLLELDVDELYLDDDLVATLPYTPANPRLRLAAGDDSSVVVISGADGAWVLDLATRTLTAAAPDRRAARAEEAA